MHASSQGHSLIDQGPPRNIGGLRKFVLQHVWRGQCQGELVHLLCSLAVRSSVFVWAASWFQRARVARVLGAWGRSVDTSRAGILASAFRVWELEQVLSDPFHLYLGGHRVRGRWYRGTRSERV